MNMSIKEIEAILMQVENENDPIIEDLAGDKRKGVQQLLRKWEKRIERKKAEKAKFKEMTYYERKARQEGFKWIAGIDEAGRGPLAGPVVAAAVILPETFYLPGLDDSKKLTERKRNEYFEIIKNEAVAVGIGMIEPPEIDRINIYEAAKKAMALSVERLETKPDFLLIDAMDISLPIPCESIVKGDSRSISIAAASVIAKVTRDMLMKEISRKYPQYHFDKNAGYGTKEHLEALRKYGITPHHRKSFQPVKELLQN